MRTQGTPTAAADVTVNAGPDEIYGLITDLPTMAELAEETTAMTWHRGDSVRPGSVFKGKNRNGSKTWTTTCTITEAEPGRVFAFDVYSLAVPVAHWRYDITSTEGGCLVTESTWDRRPGWFAKIAGYATGVHDRETANTKHIKSTLDRLKVRAESS